MQSKPRRSSSQSFSRQRRKRYQPRLGPLELRTMLSVVAPSGVSTPSVQYNAITTAAPYGPSQVYQGYGYNRVIFQQGSNYYLGNGAGQTIAIVDAFNDASIKSNLASFDSQVGLPAPPTFTVLNETGGTSLTGVTSASSRRSATYGWSIEESLDVEWAHTIAPDANIVLFEANNNSNLNLDTAVETAAKAATYTQYGLPPAGVVSDSWGGGESSTETATDPDFTSVGNTVTFVFSSGDSHPVEYPSTSPNVLAVGGTALHLQTSGFGTTYNGEGWYDTSVSNGGGGGSSAYESEPSYQLGVQSSGQRQTPDVALNADGTSDVLVEDTNYPFGGYYGVYGTSEAAPMWAATLSIVDQGLSLAEGKFTTLGNAQQYVYQLPLNNTATPAYHEITGTYKYLSLSGSTTITTTYTATPGYNTLTGLGSPIPTSFIPDMIKYAVANGVNPASIIKAEIGGGNGSGGGNATASAAGGAPGGGTFTPTGQSSGILVAGGHVTVALSPSQTAQPMGAGLSPTGAVQATNQAVAVSSPSAANAFVPASAASLGQGVATPSKALLAERDGLSADALPHQGIPQDVFSPVDGIQPTRGDVVIPSSGQSFPAASLLARPVVDDSAFLPVLPVDTLPGLLVEQSVAEEQPRAAPVDASTQRLVTAGLAVVMGSSFAAGLANRKTRFKRPLLRPRD
jgi:hypothetical protein